MTDTRFVLTGVAFLLGMLPSFASARSVEVRLSSGRNYNDDTSCVVGELKHASMQPKVKYSDPAVTGYPRSTITVPSVLSMVITDHTFTDDGSLAVLRFDRTSSLSKRHTAEAAIRRCYK